MSGRGQWLAICRAICRASMILLAPAWLVAAGAAPEFAAAPPATSRPAAASSATVSESPVSLAVLNGASPSGSESDMALGELTKAMEATAGLKVLDRDHVQKLLAEHQLSLTGLVQQPVKQGAMLGAKYLLYAETERNASAATLAMICLEVSSGNVIWERAFALDEVNDPKTVGRWASGVARDALAAITANEHRRDRPAATVLAAANRSKSQRLDFLEDSLRGLLEDLLESRGYRLLRRRNPGLLAKETMLGTSGMVRPDAAVLAEAAELVVTADFVESPSGDVAFEQTPIKLTLGLRLRGQTNRDTAITFTLAELKKLSGELRSALPAASGRRGAPGTATPSTSADDDMVSRRLEAARLMAELKDLRYMASLEDHRRQIELAQRVIYLDPSAKDAYYWLGESLDALTRQTWHPGGTHEGSSQATAEAFYKYLSFPRTNKDRVWGAFRCLLSHVSVLNRSTPEKSIPLMAEFVRWEHHLDPVKPPLAIVPDYYFPDWWDAHPEQRLEFCAWVDRLYENKQHRSVLPFKVAVAHEQLKQYAKAAEYYYDGFVSHHLTRIELNSVACAAGSFESARSRAMDLAKYLDAKRSAELLARLSALSDTPAPNPGDLYGEAYGSAKDLYDYAYKADGQRIERLHSQTVQPEFVPTGKTLLRSVIVRRTPAGLWMQGGTDDGKLALFHSSNGRGWGAVKMPEQMTKVVNMLVYAESINHVTSIVQLGDEVLFGTPGAGLFVYTLKKDTWRQYGPQQGLAVRGVARMSASADGKSAWIASGAFICRYRDGQVFMPKAKVELFPDGMATCQDRLLMHCEGKLLAVQLESGAKTTLLTRSQQRAMTPVPQMFFGPPRDYNSAVATWQRLAVIGKNVYLADKWGLAVLTAAGKCVALWRPDTFYYWTELGGWVAGNCPLPPCLLTEAIQDDANPNMLWLVSKNNDVIPPYNFGYACGPKELWKHYLDIGGDTVCFITAFDTQSNSFSKPMRTATPFTHAQPFGDYVYLTGRTFSRLPKKLWVADQPGADADAAPTAECPDTPVGRASRALLLGRRDEAVKHLKDAMESGTAPEGVRKMLKDLAAKERAQTKPASASTHGDNNK